MSIAAVEASDDESVGEAIPHHILKKETKDDVEDTESVDEAENGDEDEET